MTILNGEIVWQDVLDTAILEADQESLSFDPYSLQNFNDNQKTMILHLAEQKCFFVRWGILTFHGRRFYAAHKAALAITPASGEGTTGSESVGNISISKTMPVNNPSAEQGILETHFGRQYYELLTENVNKRQRKFFVG